MKPDVKGTATAPGAKTRSLMARGGCRLDDASGIVRIHPACYTEFIGRQLQFLS
jgi:hypothetical protein